MPKPPADPSPRLYSLAAQWSEDANTLDERADELEQAQLGELARDCRAAADLLRLNARKARALAASLRPIAVARP